MLPTTPVIVALNTALGVLILFDLAARLWISENLRRELTRIYTLADLVVVASLLLAPLITENLAFLRVLRGLRLLHASSGSSAAQFPPSRACGAEHGG